MTSKPIKKWKLEFDESALKELKKLGKQTQKEVIHYLKSKIATDEDPYRFGKALKGSLAGLWRYRVGKYRVVCKIQDEEIIVLVLRVAKRDKVYKTK